MNTISNICYQLADTTDKKEIIKTRIKSLISPIKHLILAGNIGNIYNQDNLKDILTFLRSYVNIDKYIFYVPGYHEYENCKNNLETTYEVDKKLQELCKQCGIEFLQTTAIEGPEFVILGCTLWSLITQDAYSIVDKSLNIFQSKRQYTDLHCEQTYWLHKCLNKNRYTKKKLIVITYHSPSEQTVTSEQKQSGLDTMIASTLDYLVEKSDMWFFGNSTISINTYILKTPLISRNMNEL